MSDKSKHNLPADVVARIEQYEEIIERHYRARDPESRAEGWMDTAAREIAALRTQAATPDIAERDALRRDNAFLGYVIHGPLLPEQEARATKIERDALRADNERLRLALNEIGYEINPAFARERARAALTAKDQANG